MRNGVVAIVFAGLCGLAWGHVPARANDDDNDRILIFSKTAGFRHDAIPVAVTTLNKLAASEGLAADHTEDATAFTADNLARYRVVVFASTTGDVLDASQQAALERYVEGGGGYMGVHAAADTEYDWRWYQKLVGATFASHPKGLQSTRVQPERDGKPAGSPWPITDELYNFRANPRSHVDVIATIDEHLYEGGTMGTDHPIAWCRRVGSGRSWYTGLGHDAAVYSNPGLVAQVRQGLAWAAGRGRHC